MYRLATTMQSIKHRQTDRQTDDIIMSTADATKTCGLY